MAEPLTADWLRAQRWFRSKQRPIDSLAEVDRAPLIDHVALTVIEVSYADGGSRDRYLVPVADGRDPADGDGAWRAMLGAIADDATVGGAHGTFLAARTDALDVLLPSARESAAALDERRLRVEQSNTSVVLGERLILKLYRLLEPGISPDLEVSAFLTDAGFEETPAVAGSIVYQAPDGEPAAAAMLQAFVPSTGDAWSAMLDALASGAARATEMAAAIGRLTVRMHAAFASRPHDPAFPARVASVAETAGWRASAESQLAQAVAALRGEAHDRLVAAAPQVTARFADAFGRASGDQLVSRIHGDYHLGQLLARSDGGFSVIDFEGEPARPLAERRQPSSPLRDVAGMLRSLDYAARTAGRRSALDADAWLAEARAAFLGEYGVLGALVDAFELEKACYEIRYEANNRPSWLWLPLAAVERLAHA
jgi:maltose alpha-D-glucosyltransferase/alpha-amylase